MQYIEVKAEGATLSVTATPPPMAAGFVGVFAVKATYDEVWDGLTQRICSYRSPGVAPASVLEEDGEFVVPIEVNSRPSFDFSLSGTAEDGRRITTNAIRVQVLPSVPVGDEAGDPTPSVSAQALTVATAADAKAGDALLSVADLTARVDELVITGGVAPATATTLGTVKVGTGLVVTEDGTLSVEAYTGETDVTPKVDDAVTLSTSGKVMQSDVTVSKVPQYEVSNEAEGLTLIIGEESINGD